MLTAFRTYRLIPALVAAAMLFGAAIPLVQEICAMAEAAHMPFGHPCCCGDDGESGHEGAVKPSATHHQPAAHVASATSAEAPCHGEGDMGFEAACCTAQEATAAHLITPPPPPESPKPALASASGPPLALPSPKAAGGEPLFSGSASDPPPTSVSTHVLYAVFLI